MAHEPERVRALELALELAASNKVYSSTIPPKETTAKQIVKDAKTFMKFLNNVNEPDTEG